MVDLAAVVRVIAVQLRVARIGRVGVGQPERVTGGNRLSVADRAQEPVPGLAAADRTAHRITPRPGRNGALAPRAQPDHGPTSVSVTAPDSNGDSNSSDQRRAAATGDSA